MFYKIFHRRGNFRISWQCKTLLLANLLWVNWYCCKLHQARFEQKDYVNCYAEVERTLLLEQKVNHLMSISWQFVLFMEMTWTNIICTRNLPYLERFLMALIRIALTYHLSLIDCVSWHNHKKICCQKS